PEAHRPGHGLALPQGAQEGVEGVEGEAPGPWSRRVSTGSMSSPAPNEGLEPTPSSVRCAPASGCGSGPAFGFLGRHYVPAARWEVARPKASPRSCRGDHHVVPHHRVSHHACSLPDTAHSRRATGGASPAYRLVTTRRPGIPCRTRHLPARPP